MSLAVDIIFLRAFFIAFIVIIKVIICAKDDNMYRERRKGNFLRVFLTILVTSIGVGGLLFFLTSGFITRKAPIQTVPQVQKGIEVPMPQQIATDIGTNTSTVAAVAKSASPGVVGISVLKVESGSLFDKNATEKWGVGSGVIASPNGYILTNNHVAGGANKKIIISLIDGRSLDGVTVWSDPILDLAVVKVNVTGLTTIPLGDANTLQVGETAIAIGNPLGLQFQRTVTSGIISALNRTIKIDTDKGPNYMEDLIQTDASINPGNSGGPLLNTRGEVVGINTIKVTSAEAIGFAVPVNVAIPIIKKLIEKGDFVEPYMGVFAYDKEVIPYLNNNLKIDNGIYVVNIDENGPAFKKGIKVGCIITKIDDNVINTMLQLRTYIYSKNPGDTINVTHISEGNTMVAAIKLSAKDTEGLVTR